MDTTGLNTYVLNFSTDGVDLVTLESVIKSHPIFKAYWNHIPLVFCVKSYATAAQIARHLDFVFPRGNFMVAQIDPSNVDGRLPQSAWAWFYEAPASRDTTPTEFEIIGDRLGRADQSFGAKLSGSIGRTEGPAGKPMEGVFSHASQRDRNG